MKGQSERIDLKVVPAAHMRAAGQVRIARGQMAT
jgi:hypothetical protein